MINLDKNSKKIVVGAVVGGIVGIGALSIICACRKEKKCTLKTIGDTIVHIVENLDSCNIQKGATKAVHEIEDKIKENEEVLTTCFELASIGLNLWKKIKARG